MRLICYISVGYNFKIKLSFILFLQLIAYVISEGTISPDLKIYDTGTSNRNKIILLTDKYNIFELKKTLF